MVIYFLLTLVLHFDGQPDKLSLGGSHHYDFLDDCRKDGSKMANWLTQPQVRVEWQCEKKVIWTANRERLG